jgi:outer membrane protein insertion porin family/translocation and assembly module TamA
MKRHSRKALLVAAAIVAVAGPSLPLRGAPAGEDSGPRRIAYIRLEGCKQIACRTVKSILLQKPAPWWELKLKEGGYDPFWAQEDQKRIVQFYRSRGFYSVQVAPAEVSDWKWGPGVMVSYRIAEGDPVMVSSLKVIYVDGRHEDDDPERLAKLMSLKEGERFELDPYQKSAAAIANYYKDEAFYRVVVEREAEVDPQALTAAVTYRITKGARYRIRSIAVEGCEQTDPGVVERCLSIKERTRWSRKQVLEDQRRIQALPIYRTVRMEEEVDDEKHRIDMTVRVTEAEPQMIKLGVGYGSEEQFRIQAMWRHVIFWGGARQLSVSARWSQLLEREEVSFLQPNLRRPDEFMQFNLKREVQSEDTYHLESFAFSPTYHLVLTRYLWAELSFHLEDNRLSEVTDFSLLEDADITKEDLSREGLLSALSLRLEWADVDDPVRPRRGARASLYLEYAGGPLAGDFSYLKVLGEARGYWPFGPVVGALKWKLGWAEPLADLDQLPLFKRYYAGGTGSVRGFDRRGLGPLDDDGDPMGGAKLWEGSLEFRFPIWEQLGGVVFLDSGWVWMEDQPYQAEDVIYSAGCGLRYDTPVGPLAFDVAFPLTGREEYTGVKIHFNIGNTF